MEAAAWYIAFSNVCMVQAGSFRIRSMLVSSHILYWTKFRVVLRVSNNTELVGTGTARHHLVDVCGMMCQKKFPDKNVMVICHGHTKQLNLGANVITEITENVCGCPTAVHTPNPTSWTLHASKDIRREPWIPRLNCK
jgi:hypothetical protein